MRTAAALLALSLVTACVTTPEELRSAPGGMTTFSVELPYQDAYDRAVSGMRRCFAQPFVVAGDLYTDKKRAAITLSLQGGLGNRTEIELTMRSVSAESTEVLAVYRQRSTDGVIRAMRAWMAGDATASCYLKAGA